MAMKIDTEVIINGKVYKLSGYEEEEYLQRVASYINNKISSFAESSNYARLNQEMKQLMLDINLADDYFKTRHQADLLELDLQEKELQMYDVKQDLVSAQLRVEALEQEVESLKRDLGEKEKEMIRLQAEMESLNRLLNSRKKEGNEE